MENGRYVLALKRAGGGGGGEGTIRTGHSGCGQVAT